MVTAIKVALFSYLLSCDQCNFSELSETFSFTKLIKSSRNNYFNEVEFNDHFSDFSTSQNSGLFLKIKKSSFHSNRMIVSDSPPLGFNLILVKQIKSTKSKK